MDMTRLVPSLFQAGTNGSQPKLQCLHCQYVANSEMEMDEHMSQHRCVAQAHDAAHVCGLYASSSLYSASDFRSN